ncbi:MAG: hypothetical protein AAFP99_04670 [Pseudomonadota bacterium]
MPRTYTAKAVCDDAAGCSQRFDETTMKPGQCTCPMFRVSSEA